VTPEEAAYAALWAAELGAYVPEAKSDHPWPRPGRVAPERRPRMGCPRCGLSVAGTYMAEHLRREHRPSPGECTPVDNAPE
jgi:ribosomal protein S27AE